MWRREGPPVYSSGYVQSESKATPKGYQKQWLNKIELHFFFFLGGGSWRHWSMWPSRTWYWSVRRQRVISFLHHLHCRSITYISYFSPGFVCRLSCADSWVLLISTTANMLFTSFYFYLSLLPFSLFVDILNLRLDLAGLYDYPTFSSERFRIHETDICNYQRWFIFFNILLSNKAYI